MSSGCTAELEARMRVRVLGSRDAEMGRLRGTAADDNCLSWVSPHPFVLGFSEDIV